MNPVLLLAAAAVAPFGLWAMCAVWLRIVTRDGVFEPGCAPALRCVARSPLGSGCHGLLVFADRLEFVSLFGRVLEEIGFDALVVVQRVDAFSIPFPVELAWNEGIRRSRLVVQVMAPDRVVAATRRLKLEWIQRQP